MRFPKNIDPYLALQLGVVWAVRGALFAGALGAVASRHWAIVFVTILTLIFTFIPRMLGKKYNLFLPIEFEVGIILFTYASLFLGDVHGYYTKFWWWDALLHGGSAIALGFAGFVLLYMLLQGERVRASPAMLALFAFCFALACGALWEIVEFSIDGSFGTNMQKSGLVDTMWDIIMDVLGALIAAIVGYRYLKARKPHIIERILRRLIARNPDLLRSTEENAAPRR